jgi:hypothetical protein
MPTRRETRRTLLVAPAAFVIVALYNYLVAPGLCGLGLEGQFLFRLFSFTFTAIGVAAGLWGLYASYRHRVDADAASSDPANTTKFLSVGGIMLSVLFIALTIIAGISSLAFAPCQPV